MNRKKSLFSSALGNTFIFLGVLLLLLTLLQLAGKTITIGGDSSANISFPNISTSTSNNSSSINSSSSSSSQNNEIKEIALDFRHELSSTTALTTTTLLTFLNGANNLNPFDTVSDTGYIYKDTGGLKFGSSTQSGFFTAVTKGTYKFNKVMITGLNYSTYSTTSETWSCDSASLSVNDSNFVSWTTNAEDKTVQAPIETKTFTLETSTNTLKINSNKRFVILEIKLEVI